MQAPSDFYEQAARLLNAPDALIRAEEAGVTAGGHTRKLFLLCHALRSNRHHNWAQSVLWLAALHPVLIMAMVVFAAALRSLRLF